MTTDLKGTPEGQNEKERTNKTLSDPNTTADERGDIKCHLTGILLAQMLSEDDAKERLP
jgi:hypothetical protein